VIETEDVVLALLVAPELLFIVDTVIRREVA